MALVIGITIAVFLTAVLSGIVGMAGGIVLMGVLITTLSVATAMVVHGAVQAASNGARFIFLREHMMWHVLGPYALGAGVTVAAFLAFTFVPDPAIVLILIGALPWLARIIPASRGLDIREPKVGVICGITVTAAQLLAGASGPLLDVFYVNTPVDRFKIIATKAFTQTLGHLIKLVYYGVALETVGASLDDQTTLLLIGFGVVAAIFGARVGTWILNYVDDQTFRRVSGWIILVLGTVCIVKGVTDLI